jgi:hypothetical protein
MVPIGMANEETLNQVPEEVRQYLRALRRRIMELEQTDAQQRIAALEATDRKLQTQVDELRGLASRQQQEIQGLRRQVADTRAQLQTDSPNSSLPLPPTASGANAGRPRHRTSPARGAAGNPATRVSNACWSPATRSSKRSPVSPRLAAAVAGL